MGSRMTERIQSAHERDEFKHALAARRSVIRGEVRRQSRRSPVLASARCRFTNEQELTITEALREYATRRLRLTAGRSSQPPEKSSGSLHWNRSPSNLPRLSNQFRKRNRSGRSLLKSVPASQGRNGHLCPMMERETFIIICT